MICSGTDDDTFLAYNGDPKINLLGLFFSAPRKFMKKCILCDAPLIKRAHESEPRFQKKQFCSTTCSRKYLKEHKMGWWSKEGDGLTALDMLDEQWDE